MASYATVAAEAETEKPLLNRDVRVTLKTVIGGAAAASFVLGALAAAVVSGAPARTNSNFAAAVAPDATHGLGTGPAFAADSEGWPRADGEHLIASDGALPKEAEWVTC